MAHLILSRSGFESLVVETHGRLPAIWLDPSVLNDHELAELRARGVDATCFNEPLSREDNEAIFDAIRVIQEHHPGQPVWLECGEF